MPDVGRAVDQAILIGSAGLMQPEMSSRSWSISRSVRSTSSGTRWADSWRRPRHPADVPRLQGPLLIVRCTDSGEPGVLDRELDLLERANPNVEVVRRGLKHLAPAWDAIDDIVGVARDFLSRPAT